MTEIAPRWGKIEFGILPLRIDHGGSVALIARRGMRAAVRIDAEHGMHRACLSVGSHESGMAGVVGMTEQAPRGRASRDRPGAQPEVVGRSRDLAGMGDCLIGGNAGAGHAIAGLDMAPGAVPISAVRCSDM